MNEYEALTAMLKEARRGFLVSVKAEGRTPTEIIDREVLLPAWEPGAYAVNDVRVHNGQVWRCCQGHDSAGNPGWEPGTVPALWAPYHTTDPAKAKPYLAPTGAQDAYQKGECMLWTDGAVYRCLTDATVHGPDGLPAAWEAA